MALVSKNFSDIITFTRASTATYFDASGTLQSAATDDPRFDYNPSTLAAQGLLIEEARTNSIRNNTMVGAVAGTPGTQPTNWSLSWIALAQGLQYSIAGVGSENGIAYIDVNVSGTFTGTPGATSATPTFEAGNIISASVGQTWTQSVYLKLVSGSLSNVELSLRLSELNSGGSTIGSTTGSGITVTSGNLSTGRASFTATTAQATTAFVQPVFRFVYSALATYNFTLRIGLPQLELGAFATSVIPTTTTALTRAADVASVNTLSPWFNAAEGTIYVQGTYSFIASGTPGLARFSDSTNDERIFLAIAGGTQRFTVVDNNVEVVDISRTGVVAGTPFAQAAAYKLNDFASVINGGAVGTDTLGGIPTVTTLRFSRDIAGGYPNGYLRRFTYYPRRLSNAELQAITA